MLSRFVRKLRYRSLSSAAAGVSPKTPVTGGAILFDTHKVIQRLELQGFTTSQAEAILDVMIQSMNESLSMQVLVLATKEEHVGLKAELSEKVFNSTLKFDIAQRHMRELLVRDFNNLKQEIRTLESNDFHQIRQEIYDVEKKILLRKQEQDETLNRLQLDIEKVEKRVLQYAVGLCGTTIAIGLGFARLIL